MNNQEKEDSGQEDKCDNCGDIDAEQYWDYDDGSVLCQKCHKKIGDEWDERIQTESEDDEEIPIKTTHKKSKSTISSGSNTNMKRYVIGGAVFIVALILIFSAFCSCYYA